MSTPPKMKSRLGRGLSSLISVAPPPEDVPTTPDDATFVAPSDSTGAVVAPLPQGQPLEVPTQSVQPNPHQPRRDFDQASLAELAASLKSTGLIQPIIVRRVGEGYELIAGERRLRAAKLAGLATIPAIIREVDSFSQAQMALVENVQRQDLNPLERAQAYKLLMEQLGLTQQELAGRLGEDRSSIANHLRLLDLLPEVQNWVRDQRLSLGHAKLLAGVGTPAEQLRLAILVVEQGLSVRNLERLIQLQAPAKKARPASTRSAHLGDLEKSMSRQLGMRVQIQSGQKKGKGQVQIHYGSLDEFDQLLSRLGVKVEE